MNLSLNICTTIELFCSRIDALGTFKFISASKRYSDFLGSVANEEHLVLHLIKYFKIPSPYDSFVHIWIWKTFLEKQFFTCFTFIRALRF